jgi:predicted PurR-regulated permease PerM
MTRTKEKTKLTSWWAILIYGAVGAYLLNHLGTWLETKFPSLNFAVYLLSGLIIFIAALFIWEIGVRFMNIYELVNENNKKLKEIEKKLKKSKK